MKILLSAYACEPDKGSEPGVGWNWALALERRGYDVHVITRSNNREAIERTLLRDPRRLQFHYFDLPQWARFWKRWPGGIYLYYLLWQFGAYRNAKRLHAREKFDLVHHITFVSFRQPSFMGGLGIPFIFGPVGGGESMPRIFRRGLPASGRIAEISRGLGNQFVAIDPFMRHTYGRAQMIVCATHETLAAVPDSFRQKCLVQRAVGIENSRIEGPNAEPASSESRPQFLFVGRLLYWKGLHLAFRALAHLRDQLPQARLRVIGEGPDAGWLRAEAQRLNVADLVEWIPPKPQPEIWDEYHRSVGFIFPSLHDSGGMVVLEALAAGLPVICLNVGGPGSMVTPTCGFPVQTEGVSEARVVDDLASAMISLAKDPDLRSRLSQGGKIRARETTWDVAADALYAHLLDLRTNMETPSNNPLIEQ